MIKIIPYLLFTVFSFYFCSAIAQTNEGGARKKTELKSKKNENLNPSLFTLCDSASNAQFSQLTSTDAGNLEQPLVVIVASDETMNLKSFHAMAKNLENGTKNSIRSIATPIRGNLAQVLFINSQEGLNLFFGNIANKDLRIFLFHGLEKMDKCKDPLFKSLNARNGYSKFLQDINKNFFPGENGPVQFIQKEERIQN